MKYLMGGNTRTSIIASSTAGWAKIVFPELSNEGAINALWEQIFNITRINCEDPVAAWNEHDKNLKHYVHYLNNKNLKKLHYKAPGTDLEVYLADDHKWVGGSKLDVSNTSYVANIPTEEVFTTPHRNKVNGTLKSTMPLSLRGQIIENFGFTFKDGKVVDFYADKGAEVLEKLMENDEGASFLGEVALVPHDSPISNSGIVFSNTLFDENASCHFALGKAYNYAMQNGTQMSQDELSAKGANQSFIHVDFMVGCAEMHITAETFDGDVITLFKDGNWAV